MHQRGHVADWTDVNLRTGQEGNGAIKIDREATLDLIEDDTFNTLIGFEFGFQTNPAFFAAGLLARKNSFTKSIFNALDIDFDFVAWLQCAFFGADAEFLQRHAAFNFKANVDNGDVFFNGGNNALGYIAFGEIMCEK